MRVFCGLASEDATDEQSASRRSGTGDRTCSAAIVNTRGGLIGTVQVTDDARGFAKLCRMWAQHSPTAAVPVACYGDVAALADLAAVVGHPIVNADDTTAGGGGDGTDRAIRVARALASGELAASTGVASAPATRLRPLSTSLQAVATGRQSCADTLVDVLRAVFPAVLAAWDDPTEPAALAVLTKLPNATAVRNVVSEELASDLAAVADPGQVAALTAALGQAVHALAADSPAESEGLESTSDPAVSATVVAAAEAVIACDRSLDACTAAMVAQLNRAHESEAAAEPAAEPTAKRLPKKRRKSVVDHDEPPTIRMPVGGLPPVESLSAFAPPGEPAEAERPAADDRTARSDAESAHRASQPFPEMPEPPVFDPNLADAQPPQFESAIPDNPPARRRESASQEVSGERFVDIDEIGADDDGLLIFSQAKSAWFAGPAGETEQDWNTPADDGWRAAAAASEVADSTADTTSSGLPKRKPQANLVPGTAPMGVEDDSPPEPVHRDPSLLASNTAGYFRGWSRARQRTTGGRERPKVAV